jgi:hypothetical protein
MSRIFGPIDQICWVVPDIRASMTYWSDVLGVGPWFCIPHLRPEGFEYMGRPSNAEITLAIAYSGRMQLELIEQHNDAPSMYRDASRAGRVPGQHHLGFFRRDYETRLEEALEAGYTVGQSGSLGGGIRFAYLTTEKEPGMIAELVELTDPSEATFVTMHQASLDWDGSDPIRSLAAQPG